MHNKLLVYIIFVIGITSCLCAQAQEPDDESPETGYPQRRVDSRGRPIKQDTTEQKLQHRDPLEDSITISYHYFDSTKPYKLDSSINDFNTRYPLPYYYNDLGNFGNAAQSLIFSPYMKPGWDAGFHSYDIYNFTVENTRLFTTTRPYTELAYLLGSKTEQFINIKHTQNRKSNLNIGFEYRLINAPGSLKNQNTVHNNIRINLSYQSNNKRYNNYLIYISNKIRSSENGGIQDDKELTGLSFNDPFAVPTRLGNAASVQRNPFATIIGTGTLYDQRIILLRQSYDFGQKDSVVTDSVTYKLFYPRLRFQHSIEYLKENYAFLDNFPVDSLYLMYYNYIPGKTVSFKDRWEKLTNDFSIISFPQKNNLNQFLKLGIGNELIAGGFYPYLKKYKNIYFEGEYRNRTRNQKWDVVASGLFYSAGNYAGDYEAYISLERLLNKNKGAVKIGFQNVNRSPSAIFSKGVTSFPLFTDGSFNKENISRGFAGINLSKFDLTLTGDYYIISNYMYFDNFFSAKQQSALFNVLHIGVEKKIKLKKHWNWYIEAHIQKTTGDPPVHLPFFLTRHRFAFEGNFFRNLFLSTGFEVRYYSPFKADDYSPLNGQFFVQNVFSTISNSPDINAFFNFRIKSFKGFIRLENLNTLNPDDKYRFTKNNFTAPHYPQRTMWFRAGVWWNFVN